MIDEMLDTLGQYKEMSHDPWLRPIYNKKTITHLEKALLLRCTSFVITCSLGFTDK